MFYLTLVEATGLISLLLNCYLKSNAQECLTGTTLHLLNVLKALNTSGPCCLTLYKFSFNFFFIFAAIYFLHSAELTVNGNDSQDRDLI